LVYNTNFSPTTAGAYLEIALELVGFDLLVVALGPGSVLHLESQGHLGAAAALVDPFDLEGFDNVLTHGAQVLGYRAHLGIYEGVPQDQLFVLSILRGSW
jgi:hypothetical protein